jgi:LysM repeat protein
MIKKSMQLLLVALCFTTATASAQRISATEYIALYKDLAIREMKRMGVPAAITLAQGLLETESGNSDLLKKSNNHFGIKCKNTWSGNGVSHDDDAAGECFRTYKNAEESYRDHSNFLRGNDRYSPLFSLNPADYKAWAHGLKKAGYATNPKYPDILIKHIEQYNLQQYSLAAAEDVPKFEKNKYEDDKEDPAALNDLDNAAPTIEGKPATRNGIKYLYATKGTSLLAIATSNDIQLGKLLEYNDRVLDGILDKDQCIFLQKKPKKGATEFCIVKNGETLYDIAQNNAVQLSSLAVYNNITEGTYLAAGTKIYLQPIREMPLAKTAEKKQMPAKIYEVQPREGLYAISKKYGVTVQQLKEWNNLTSDNISVGQQLIVSK